MLARPNRLLTAHDFRSTMRAGRRIPSPLFVAHVRSTGEERAPRFGFVTGSRVGSAVVRNRIRRRLRAIARELLPGIPDGVDVVIRALPTAADADWTTLRSEVERVMARSAESR